MITRSRLGACSLMAALLLGASVQVHAAASLRNEMQLGLALLALQGHLVALGVDPNDRTVALQHLDIFPGNLAIFGPGVLDLLLRLFLLLLGFGFLFGQLAG